MRILLGVILLVQSVVIWHTRLRLANAEAALVQLHLSITDFNYLAAQAHIPQFGMSKSGEIQPNARVIMPEVWDKERDRYTRTLKGEE